MDKIWLKNYPKKMPETIDAEKYSSLIDLFDKNCQKYSHKYLLNSMGVRLTFKQVDKLSRHFAAFLQQHLGLRKSQRFAIMMPNLLQYPVAILGALRAGLTIVNVNPLYTPRELIHQLNDAEVEAIIVLNTFASVLQKALPKTQIKHVVVTQIGDLFGFPKGNLVNWVVKYLKQACPAWEIEQAIMFKQAMQLGNELKFEAVAIGKDDLAFLQYTGGTTGLAKGAMLSHGNVAANVVQGNTWIAAGVCEGKEAVVTALPMYHIFSLTVCFWCFIELGGELLLIVNPRDQSSFIKILAKSKPTVFIGLNTLFNVLTSNPDFVKLDFSSYTFTIAGGMSVNTAVAKRWHEVTGVPVLEGYGLTEASPLAIINPVNISEFDGSIGMPIPSTEVELRDKDNNLVAQGEKGELWLRGPQVMKGYWNNVEATTDVIDNEGWLRTGDIAYMDERGYFYLVDRVKDMILVSGFNVYPNEIEETLMSHPGVVEVAVVGVPSERTGEAVKAFIVKNDPKLMPQEIVAYCRERLTPYKVPKQIEFRDELPKSNVGKILRRALREA